MKMKKKNAIWLAVSLIHSYNIYIFLFEKLLLHNFLKSIVHFSVRETQDSLGKCI